MEYYYEEPGQYIVELNVEDDEGIRSSSSDTLTITVSEKSENNNPVAVITSPKTGSIFDSSQIVQFSSQGSTDLDGDELLFTWSSSLDGELFTTPSFFAETFLSDGIHLITLTVSDSRGGLDTLSVQITVQLVTEESSDAPILPALNAVSILSVLTLISIFRRNLS